MKRNPDKRIPNDEWLLAVICAEAGKRNFNFKGYNGGISAPCAGSIIGDLNYPGRIPDFEGFAQGNDTAPGREGTYAGCHTHKRYGSYESRFTVGFGYRAFHMGEEA